jgi:hypothetical protein
MLATASFLETLIEFCSSKQTAACHRPIQMMFMQLLAIETENATVKGKQALEHKIRIPQ